MPSGSVTEYKNTYLQLLMEDFDYSSYIEKDGVNYTFIMAVERQDIKGVKELLDKGADVNFVVRGKTALILACENNNTEMVKLLLDSGANPKVSVTERHLPVYSGSPLGKPFVKIEKNTALDIARRNKNIPMAQMLMSAGALKQD